MRRRSGNLKSKSFTVGVQGTALNQTKDVRNNPQEKTIGKITVNLSQILGHGSGDTIVCRGRFEDRPVAIKRVLPDQFTFAVREAQLLKISDDHPNVIRYHSTERDELYRYIALDLCVASLVDWVEGRYQNELIDGCQVLNEACQGLGHLHSVVIVHRDLKPANILLRKLGKNEISAVISDFGLSKMIPDDKISYSSKSGLLGTNGWIAPEVLKKFSGKNPDASLTTAVDVFSMGCIFYHVLTYELTDEGHHPFGESIHRNSNILRVEQDLSKLSGDSKGMTNLIQLMIHQDPEQRPTIQAVLKHPIFWSTRTILNFVTDIGNRISKKNKKEFPLLKQFEEGGALVVGDDWTAQFPQNILTAMTKNRRQYDGESVKELLRSLRNATNHFSESIKPVPSALGGTAEQAVVLWMTKFPTLLPYTWHTFQGLKEEEDFEKYYHPEFDFGIFEEYVNSSATSSAEKSDEVGSLNDPKRLVNEICADSDARATWKTVELSNIPSVFKCVCTIRSNAGGNVLGEGSGGTEKEAEYGAAMDILSKIMEKSPKTLVNEACLRMNVKPKWETEELFKTPSTFKSVCTIPLEAGSEVIAAGDGATKKLAQQKAALRMIPQIFTSDVLLQSTEMIL